MKDDGGVLTLDDVWDWKPLDVRVSSEGWASSARERASQSRFLEKRQRCGKTRAVKGYLFRKRWASKVEVFGLDASENQHAAPSEATT